MKMFYAKIVTVYICQIIQNINKETSSYRSIDIYLSDGIFLFTSPSPSGAVGAPRWGKAILWHKTNMK